MSKRDGGGACIPTLMGLIWAPHCCVSPMLQRNAISCSPRDRARMVRPAAQTCHRLTMAARPVRAIVVGAEGVQEPRGCCLCRICTEECRELVPPRALCDAKSDEVGIEADGMCAVRGSGNNHGSTDIDKARRRCPIRMTQLAWSGMNGIKFTCCAWTISCAVSTLHFSQARCKNIPFVRSNVLLHRDEATA